MQNQKLTTRSTDSALGDVASDVACLPDKIVNLYFVGSPQTNGARADGRWAPVDAGLYARPIVHRAGGGGRYGAGARPTAIVLTHRHFDHVGALKQLAERWDVPVYAHELEMPYLGRSAYPPPDPTVRRRDGAFVVSLSQETD
ncbi:MAG: MBL fold metallo-hydrolase [Pyrinomonadaceae bacterium]